MPPCKHVVTHLKKCSLHLNQFESTWGWFKLSQDILFFEIDFPSCREDVVYHKRHVGKLLVWIELECQNVRGGAEHVPPGISGNGGGCTSRMRVAFCFTSQTGGSQVQPTSSRTFCQPCLVVGFCNDVGCISYDCKLDLLTVPGTLIGQRYLDKILEAAVVSHFDINHSLASRPIFMDDNARPHRARIVVDFLNNDAVDTLPWSAKSPGLNSIEHVWDLLGRKVRERDQAVQNLREQERALVQAWNRIPLCRIHRLITSLRSHVRDTISVNGSYTRYWQHFY